MSVSLDQHSTLLDTLAELVYTTNEVAYPTLKHRLGFSDDVEMDQFIINCMASGLLKGKFNHARQVLNVYEVSDKLLEHYTLPICVDSIIDILSNWTHKCESIINQLESNEGSHSILELTESLNNKFNAHTKNAATINASPNQPHETSNMDTEYRHKRINNGKERDTAYRAEKKAVSCQMLVFSVAAYRCVVTSGLPYELVMQTEREKEIETFGHFNSGVIIEDEEEEPVFGSLVDVGSVVDKLGDESGDDETVEKYIPYTWQPDFWANFLLTIAFITCSLWWLVQQWSVRIKTAFLTESVSTLREATFFYIEPRIHRGTAELVRFDKSKQINEFIFQKQRWEEQPKTEASTATTTFKLVKAETNKPIASFFDSMGMSNGNAALKALQYYGPNKFEIPLPAFLDMYNQHLIAPFFIFQVFTNLLWCLEEYWKYSLFNIGMLFMFEASIVFTRRMSIVKLRGMGKKEAVAFVYRASKWTEIDTEKVVPGDVIRLDVNANEEYIIPCDILLINGSAVANESTLTGESVPLMKEAVVYTSNEQLGELLDIKGKHRLHILFGGTQLMETDSGNNHSAKNHQIKPLTIKEDTKTIKSIPMVGCVGIVIRTGFSSSQGKLVRKLEFSSEKVVTGSKDAFYLLSFLLIFALISSFYVYIHLKDDPKKTKFDILLRCILIITSVVPPDLPMQMAFSINTSMSKLMTLNVFCTEPYRIPLAGNIDVCCFDKTGTITTDKLSVAGISQPSRIVNNSTRDIAKLVPLREADLMSSLILAGCHSLVNINNQILGDPMETAAIESVGWKYSNDLCRPSKKLANSVVSPLISAAKSSLDIKIRHHFYSELQRMSVIARYTSECAENNKYFSLVKGSPEMIQTLLDPIHSNYPNMAWYNECSNKLSSNGFRVIALAYKPLGSVNSSSNALKQASEDRSCAESDLIFTGFVAFNCKNRADSKDVIVELMESNHKCIMITGDALLTAAHVASEVGICRPDKNTIITLIEDKLNPQLGSSTRTGYAWTKLDQTTGIAPFTLDSIPALSKSYSLCITGKVFMSLTKNLECDSVTTQEPNFLDYSDFISVYARMSPKDKETILLSMKSRNLSTVMCGDGTNDAGALKQADVGIALLSGYGNLNEEMTESEKAEASKKALQSITITNGNFDINDLSLAEQTGLLDPMLSPSQRARKLAYIKSQREISILTEQFKRENKPFPGFLAKVEYIKQQQQLKMIEQGLANGTAPVSAAPGKSILDEARENAASYTDPLEELQTGGDQLVKLGDASIAAPFTSKMPSIKSVVDIIRQGRSTLVTTIQMNQILVVNCLLSSYTLSVLYLSGVKYGERQMTALSVLGTINFLAISRGQALPHISKHSPPASIFHPALFVSIIGQFAILVATLVYFTSLATTLLPPEYTPDPEGKFKPSIVNTVVFLITSIQHSCVFAVNYKGRPYNQDVTENPIFMVSLLLTLIGTFLIASEALPWFNNWMGFVELTSNSFKNKLMAVLIGNILSTYIWDRLAIYYFLPKTYAEAKLRTEDVIRIAKYLLIVCALIYLFVPKSEQDAAMWSAIFNEEAAKSGVSA